MQKRISDRCSKLQLWLQTCLEIQHELLDICRMFGGGNPKWFNLATGFTRSGISVPRTEESICPRVSV